MSALNTFLFEEVKIGAVVNKDTLIYPTTAHKNATDEYKTISYRKGRYGQTEGRILGDVNGHIPACPYHMPRNNKRFDEPHLNISKKAVGDIIEAKDINNLIDKIKLFQYAWEAEANNIYGYSAVTGYPNALVDTSKLAYVEADGAPQPTFTVHDGRISGALQNKIPKIANIFSCSGSTLASVTAQLNTAVANKTKTFVSFGTVLYHGFPEYMDDLNSTDTHTLIHAGHSSIVGVKAIQFMENGVVSPDFKLQYLSGNKVADGGTENGHVKGKDNLDLVFNYNTAYVISYLPNNQPDTSPKYIGFILYYLGDDIVTNLPETEIITETVITSATYGIGSFGTQSKKLFGSELQIDTTKTIIPASSTQPINYDFAKTINNILISDPNSEDYNESHRVKGDAFWNQFLPRNQYENNNIYLNRIAAVKAKFNNLPIHTLHIPAQKLENNKCWKQLPNGSWVEQPYIYIFQGMEISRIKNGVFDNGDGLELTYTQMFDIYAGRWNPSTSKVEWNAGRPFKTIRAIPTPINAPSYLTEFYEFSDDFLVDTLSWLANQTYVSEGLNNSSSSGFPYFIDNFICMMEVIPSEEGDSQQFTYFDENGVGKTTLEFLLNSNYNTLGQITYFYKTGLSCSDGSAPVNNQCSITTTTIITIANTVDTTNANTITISESDITYKKGIYFVGEKSYPQIKSSDFKNIRNVLDKYLTNIITLSQSQINNGTSDNETYQELSNFLSNQAASANTYDAGDPDTSFEGYDIRQNGLIKLNFYNILVDAYKLIINGCICNTDCACNLVCACNTNCGCNYG